MNKCRATHPMQWKLNLCTRKKKTKKKDFEIISNLPKKMPHFYRQTIRINDLIYFGSFFFLDFLWSSCGRLSSTSDQILKYFFLFLSLRIEIETKRLIGKRKKNKFSISMTSFVCHSNWIVFIPSFLNIFNFGLSSWLKSWILTFNWTNLKSNKKTKNPWLRIMKTFRSFYFELNFFFFSFS